MSYYKQSLKTLEEVTNVSVTNIAVAFKGLIEASILEGIPGIASAANVAGVLTITSSSVVSNNFSVTSYTASASGTVAAVFTGVTQAEGIPAVLKSAGIAAADITLATYDTVLLTYKQDAAIPAGKIKKIVKEVKVKTEKVTKASLSKLTKVKLEEFALATYGVDIDRRKKKDEIVKEVLKLSCFRSRK